MKQQRGGDAFSVPRPNSGSGQVRGGNHSYNVNGAGGSSSSEELAFTKKRKSTYSRKGCFQCKKAHTKCDERKPKCSRCEKRSIDCTYQNQFVFQKNEFSGGSGRGVNNGCENDGNRHFRSHSGVPIMGAGSGNNGQMAALQSSTNADGSGSVVGLAVSPAGLGLPAGFQFLNGSMSMHAAGNARGPVPVPGSGSGSGSGSGPVPNSTVPSPLVGSGLGLSRATVPQGPLAYAQVQGPIPTAVPYQRSPSNAGAGIRTLPPLAVDSTQNVNPHITQQDDSISQLDSEPKVSIKQEQNSAAASIHRQQQQQQQQQQHPFQQFQQPDNQAQLQKVSHNSTALNHVYPMGQTVVPSAGAAINQDASHSGYPHKNKFSTEVQNNYTTDMGFDQGKLYQSVKQSLENNIRKRTADNITKLDDYPANNIASGSNYSSSTYNNTPTDINTQFNFGQTQTGSGGTSAETNTTRAGPDTDGDNFGADLVNIRDYIYISPTDWNFLNLLRFDQDVTRNSTPELEQDSQTNLFGLCWRDATSSEIYSVFSAYDPIQLLYATENPSAATTIPLDDPKLLNFIWTVARSTLLGGNLVLFPFENHFDPLLNNFIAMGKKYPLMKDVLIYVVALFMKDTYYNSNLKYFAHIWDRYVRMPTLKRCLDQFLIRKSNDYCDNISLTFTVTILFAANSSTRSSEWRTHLRGVHDLFLRVEKLKPVETDLESTEQIAHDCYLFVKDWFCHAEVLAWITSDKGGCFDNQEDLEDLLANASYSKFNLLNSRMDLIRGYTTDYYPVFTKLSSFLLHLKRQGRQYSGTNMLKFFYTESDPATLKHFKDFGVSTLNHLEKIRTDDEYIDKATAGLTDVRLRLSMKNCTRMYHNALKLYLEIFFIGIPLAELNLQVKLEKMLECLFSIPFQNSCSIACHWPIYLGAVVSLMIKDDNMYSHFTSVLVSFVSNGMNVASNSLERLAHISKVLSYNDYSTLVNPSHDYIVY